MDLIELVNKISLQEEIKNKVVEYIEANKEVYNLYIDDLINPHKSEKTYEKLSQIYEFDNECIHLLSIYLMSALKVYDKYKIMGISDEIFISTMKCFTRFIDECKVRTGLYYFDRAWWTHRQVSMRLFRIGELEYEFDFAENAISIHIPSDAILTKNNLLSSLNDWKIFVGKYFNEYCNYKMICSSWLLSPKLKEHLNDGSRILEFQKLFNIIKINKDDYSFMEWLFKVEKDRKICELPTKTSLQASVKKSLLNGDYLGSAYGELILDNL